MGNYYEKKMESSFNSSIRDMYNFIFSGKKNIEQR